MRGISAWLALTAACQLSEALPDRDSTDQDRGISGELGIAGDVFPLH